MSNHCIKSGGLDILSTTNDGQDRRNRYFDILMAIVILVSLACTQGFRQVWVKIVGHTGHTQLKQSMESSAKFDLHSQMEICKTHMEVSENGGTL